MGPVWILRPFSHTMEPFKIIPLSIWQLKAFVLLLIILLQTQLVQCRLETCNYLKNTCPLYLFNGMATYPNYADLNTTQLIELHGYPAENHFVTTEDKYILSVQRIPYSPKSPLSSDKEKVPVYLQHGTFASSAQWFWQPPHRALIFMLADAGYDVWLGNARGTSYSRGYAGKKPSSSYWDFSFHEIGKYDIPACINYIKNITNQSSLYFVGHSLGTTELFVFGMTRPELQSSIRTFFALSPCLYAGNTTNMFYRMAAPIFSLYFTEQTVELITGGPVVPEVIQRRLGDVTTYCAISAIECTACYIGMGGIYEVNPCLTNWTSFPGFVAHIPDAISGKTFSHEAQGVQTGVFKQYDYGPLKNTYKYGSLYAPEYDVKLYKIPSVFVVSDTDTVVVRKDLEKAAKAIGSALKETIRVQFTPFYHMDYVIASDADRLVYKRMIEIMDTRLYG